MDGDSTVLILVVVVACCLSSSAAAAGGFFMYQNSSQAASASAPVTGSPVAGAPAAAPAPASATPLQTLLASGQGQVLVSSAIDVSQGPMAFSVAPSGWSTSTVAYTMSVDILIEKSSGGWRCLLANQTTTQPLENIRRRPAVFISGADYRDSEGRVGPNYIQVVHAVGAVNTSITTSAKAPEGRYFNLTWTVGNGVLTTYLNGVVDRTGTVSGAFAWAPTNAWTWSPEGAKSGSLTVRNVYWFNKALSASEVALFLPV